MFIFEIFSQTPMYVWYFFGIIMFPIIRFSKPKNRYLPFLSAIPLMISVFINAKYVPLFFIDLFQYSMSVVLGALIGLSLQYIIQRYPTRFYDSKYVQLFLLGSFWLVALLGYLKVDNFNILFCFFLGHLFTHSYFYDNNIKLYK